MAVTFTVTPVKTHVVGSRKEVVADVACTGTPSANGDVLLQSALGLDLELLTFEVLGGTAANGTNTSAVVVGVDHSAIASFGAVKLQFYVQGTAGAANALVAYSGATAGMVFRVRAVGKGKGL